MCAYTCGTLMIVHPSHLKSMDKVTGRLLHHCNILKTIVANTTHCVVVRDNYIYYHIYGCDMYKNILRGYGDIRI